LDWLKSFIEDGTHNQRIVIPFLALPPGVGYQHGKPNEHRSPFFDNSDDVLVVPMEITFMDNGGNIFVLDEFIEQMNS
jgi:hypothetical protein